MRERRVRKCKRPSGSGAWGAYELTHDEHGIWLYTPEQSRYVGVGRDGSVGECFAGQPDAPGLHVLQLIPTGGAWWYAHWKHYAGQRGFSIDICTPAVLDEDQWSYVDLELDLIKWSPDEPLFLDDEDEFEEAVKLGQISDEERRASVAAAEELQLRLASDDEVFDRIAWSRLADAVALALPPITNVG